MTTNNQQNEPKKPAFTAKLRIGTGKNATYERIGVGFQNEKGSVYVKLAGTQVVSEFTLYPIAQPETQAEAQPE